MNVVYCGPGESVNIPLGGEVIVAPFGVPVEVPESLGESLLEQPVFEPEKPATKPTKPTKPASRRKPKET